MIARRLPKDGKKPDNFAALGRYIAGATDEGEKLEELWVVNCDAGETLEDLELALAEIEAVRKHRPGVKNKSYHLLVSFRPGDQEKLKAQDLKDIETAFAEALGFGEHQRVAGTHINTNNYHMHVAYNMVHPRTHKMHYSRHDYQALARTARELEQKYGLVVDPGMTDGKEPNREGLSFQAHDYERHTWQQSFQRWLLEHKEPILKGIHESKDWQVLHKGLAGYGVELRKRGNGLVFVEAREGKQAMKASAFDRSCSKPALERRLGPFEPLKEQKEQKEPNREQKKALSGPVRGYKPRPLVRGHPNTAALWRRYMGTRQAIPRRSGLIGMIARNWKLFLLTEAYNDPLAMVLIMAHREMLNILVGPPTPRHRRTRMPSLMPAGLKQQSTTPRQEKSAKKPPAEDPSLNR